MGEGTAELLIRLIQTLLYDGAIQDETKQDLRKLQGELERIG